MAIGQFQEHLASCMLGEDSIDNVSMRTKHRSGCMIPFVLFVLDHKQATMGDELNVQVKYSSLASKHV